jgi:hypothetical protein
MSASRLLALLSVLLVLTACQPSTPPVPTAPPAKPTAPPSLASMAGFLKPYGADGDGWPPEAAVTIQVYDRPQGKVLYTGQAQADANGRFYADVGVTTQPGMAVSVTDGKTTRATVLVPVAITAMDLEGDSVSGTAAPGATVTVYLGDSDRNGVGQATASGDGHWTASFAGLFDITEGTVAQATVRDSDGNGTIYKTEYPPVP